jgi:predicted PurR-regulated permease PerM
VSPVTQKAELPHDIARTTLGVLSIVGLIVVTLWIMSPFLGALIWATMIVVVTWPILLRVQRRLAGKRWLAVLVMTLSILFVFVLPFSLLAGAIVNYSDDAVHWVKELRDVKIPPPPDFITHIPVVGAKISTAWRETAALTPDELQAKAQPYVVKGVKWSLSVAGTLGRLMIQLLLTIVIVAVLYANGETAARGVRRFGRRLAGERGEGSVRLAGQAIRGVALGVVVTALLQSVLGGIGLAVAKVPFAAPLTAVILVACLAQLGPLLIMLPATLWVYGTGDTVMGTVLLVWSILVGIMDNFVRPILIKKGADLPLLLIFAGVIGGLLSFGVIGIFVGPVMLAVAYRLVEAWVDEVDGVDRLELLGTEPEEVEGAAKTA